MKTVRRKPLRKASAKAQSAMEYLIIYGWAILIVAVVLGALYSLGVFSGAAFLGTSCSAASGFYCTNPTLSTGGVLTVTIGQATGTTFKNTYLYFVPSGTNFSTSDPGTSIGTLNSGRKVTVNIPLPAGSPYPAAYTLGTSLSGYLYLQFTDIYGTTEANNIATVLTKVTASSGGAILSQPTIQPNIPSGIVAYVPITLTNSQSSATQSPFQQMINITESSFSSYIAYNNNFANFEYFYANGTIIPAWIESNSSGKLITWVKLTPSIPANGKLTIYLGFASKTTNLLSSSGTSGIGEAPQLSSTYAQYDDGASVFNIYTNFAGTSLPSGWTAVSGTSGTDYTVSNGLQLKTTTARIQGPSVTQNFILEGYFQFISNSPNGWDFGVYSSSSSAYGLHPDGNGGTNWATTYYYNNGYKGISNSGSTIGNGYYFIWQLINNAGSITTNFDNPSYTALYTASFTNSLSGAPITLGERFDNVATGQALNVIFNWVRVRAYPPNGVMPSVSFSGLSTA
jgi:hypothetical protein